MDSNWPSLDYLSITTRLMLWFLAISLIPCCVLTLVNNYLSVRSLERSVRSQLASISSAKTTELDNFVRERRGNIAVLSQAPRTIQTTEELSQSQAKGVLTEAARLQTEKEFHRAALNPMEATDTRTFTSLPLTLGCCIASRPTSTWEKSCFPVRSREPSWPRFSSAPRCCFSPKSRTTRSIRV